jgi:flavin reductase (DIM6/NTAB) family NADH-FMN oxidoreductase RutF
MSLVGQAQAAIDSAGLLRTFRCFAHGVTVITARAGDQFHGMTATATCGVSLDPPLLLVCVKRDTRTHMLIKQAGAFGVNLLRNQQRGIAEQFAADRSTMERFAGTAYHREVTGAPILDDTLGFFDCRVVAAYEGGDHTVFVGAVEAARSAGDGVPLIYHHGNYCRLINFCDQDEIKL